MSRYLVPDCLFLMLKTLNLNNENIWFTHFKCAFIQIDRNFAISISEWWKKNRRNFSFFLKNKVKTLFPFISEKKYSTMTTDDVFRIHVVGNNGKREKAKCSTYISNITHQQKKVNPYFISCQSHFYYYFVAFKIYLSLTRKVMDLQTKVIGREGNFYMFVWSKISKNANVALRINAGNNNQFPSPSSHPTKLF